MNEQARLRIEDADTRARFTAAEFVRMINAGAFADMKVELIRGELKRMSPPETHHSGWQSRVLIRLASLLSEDQLYGEVGIDLGQDTIVGCDAAVVRARVVENRRLRPDDTLLVVEVAVSTVSRDLGLKRMLYAEAGITCYWVIDPERAVTHVYQEPVGGEYRSVATVPFGDPLAVPGADGVITLA